jgi:Protein of unknown function (DUF3754)
MATYLDREHFIPLRVTDLVEFLASGKGARVDPNPLSAEEQAAFRWLADRLIDHYHHEFHARFRRITDAYAPFDPDRDTVAIQHLSGEDQDRAIMRLFHEIRALLEKANYKELTRAEAERVMQGASLWGLDLDVDWSVFDHIALYYRGDTVGTRTIRRWWKLWKKEDVQVPEFNRLVVILKQKAHKRLGKAADTRSVFMKIFKDMPKPDLEMVLPGTRIKLTKLDHGLILYPVLSGVALLAYKLLSELFGFGDIFSLAGGISLSWSLAGLFAGYGYRSYAGYTNKKRAYTLQLTQSLYYQVIDSNAGVFFRLLDEAEEQEMREALLAYYYLWRQPGRAMSATELDDLVEHDLQRRLGVKVDFEISDALGKLEALKLVRSDGDGFRAIPIETAAAAIGGYSPAAESSTRMDATDRLAATR